MSLKMKSMSALKKFIRKLGTKTGAVFASLAVVAVTVPVLAFSYGPFVSIQPESGTLSGGTNNVSDALASGGTTVKFSSTSGESSRCPAYPAFPDANCTGVISGSTLTPCNGWIDTPNAEYTNCLFSSSVGLTPNATNVKITNSRIIGQVYATQANFYNSGLVMTDVEVDSQSSNIDSIGGIMGYTCIRCNVHHGSKAFAGGNFHIEDSYSHDLYGEYDCGKYSDCQTHNESVLPFDGNNNTLLHNNFNSNYSTSSSGGGMSASIALYTHSDFWGPVNNVLIEKNRIVNEASPYCMYLGNTNDPDGDPMNLRLIDNVFGPCDTFLGWLRGNGNVWSNNRWSNGTVIPEPSTATY